MNLGPVFRVVQYPTAFLEMNDSSPVVAARCFSWTVVDSRGHSAPLGAP